VDLEQSRPRLRNANVAVREREGEVVFLHRIVPGGADQSYGIHVARLAGVPGPVLDRARTILAYLERHHGTEQLDGGGASAPVDQGGGPDPRKVKTGRAMQDSLFAALPDPMLDELREVEPSKIGPAEAIALIRRLKDLAGG
jgi:DNA mismatch repair protein MutS